MTKIQELILSFKSNRPHGRASFGQAANPFQLCQPKIHHLDLTFGRHHNIFRFDVPMDKIMLVGFLQGLCGLNCNVQRTGSALASRMKRSFAAGSPMASERRSFSATSRSSLLSKAFYPVR